MSGHPATQSRGRAHAGQVTGYRLQIKAAAPMDGEAPAPDDVDEGDAPLDADEQIARHEWSGDLYDGDDVPEPEDAFANLAGAEGEQAWLERAEDGTLTAWVRDSDGSVYRYSDPDGWAADVDAAGMTRVSDNPDDGQDETEQDDADLDDDEPDDDGEEPESGGPPWMGKQAKSAPAPRRRFTLDELD